MGKLEQNGPKKHSVNFFHSMDRVESGNRGLLSAKYKVEKLYRVGLYAKHTGRRNVPRARGIAVDGAGRGRDRSTGDEKTAKLYPTRSPDSDNADGRRGRASVAVRS